MSQDPGSFDITFDEQAQDPNQYHPQGQQGQTYNEAGHGGATPGHTMRDDPGPAHTMREEAQAYGGGPAGQQVSQGASTVADGVAVDDGDHDLQAIVGRTVDRYHIKKLLGEGGFGAVYLATHTLMKRDVAFKTLHKELAGDPAILYRFLREGQCSTRFKHRNAIALYDFGQMDDGTYFMAMELLPGGELREYLKKKGVLELGETFDILIQSLGALQAMHDGGVIHRDLKPDNIMLESLEDRDNFVKIFDFGIAKLLDDPDPEPTYEVDRSVLDQEIAEKDKYKTQVGAFFGTPEYGSPEQCAGEEIDARSDLYTMGVIMYELLTGGLPFVSKTPQGYLAQHMVGTPKPITEVNKDIPMDVQIVLDKALEKDPNDRYQNAIEFIEGLTECAQKNGIPVTVGMGDVITVIKTPIWKLAMLTVVPILLIGLGIFYFIPKEDSAYVAYKKAVDDTALKYKYEDALGLLKEKLSDFVQKEDGYIFGYRDAEKTDLITDPEQRDQAVVKGKWQELEEKIKVRNEFVEAELAVARKGLAERVETRQYEKWITRLQQKLLDDPIMKAKAGVQDQATDLISDIRAKREAEAKDLADRLIPMASDFDTIPEYNFAQRLKVFDAWPPLLYKPTQSQLRIDNEIKRIEQQQKDTPEKEIFARDQIDAIEQSYAANPLAWEATLEQVRKFKEDYGATKAAVRADALTAKVEGEWQAAADKAWAEAEGLVDGQLDAGTVVGLEAAENILVNFDAILRKRVSDLLSAKDNELKAVAKERFEKAVDQAATLHKQGAIPGAIDRLDDWENYPAHQAEAGPLLQWYRTVKPLHEEDRMKLIPEAKGYRYGDWRSGAGFPVQNGVDVPAFYLDYTEVTNEQYLTFLKNTNQLGRLSRVWKAQQPFFPEDLADHPVRAVSYDDAAAYAAWAGKRLATEIEWEYAGRGNEPFALKGNGEIDDEVRTHHEWPWGSELKGAAQIKAAANLKERPGKPPTTPVESFPEDTSVFEIKDLAGNVREWTSSPFLQYKDPKGLVRTVKFRKEMRVIRGASFASGGSPLAARLADRKGDFPSARPVDVGFRCAKDAVAP